MKIGISHKLKLMKIKLYFQYYLRAARVLINMIDC